ncbi:hypothetical protein FOPE_10849 [Fonsecaea pedrosoi]|nr:hypothetical protein FOPE_10849 [Fonsecaea pedrosoi]
MSLRNTVKDLRRSLPSHTASSPSSYLETEIIEHLRACPAYEAPTSSHIQPMNSDSSRSFVECTLDSELASGDAPPPYMKLSNGNRKPEYSISDPARTADAKRSRSDGALCLRCNARKAKAWYLRQTARTSP